jgi:hypothetical protein
LGESSVSLIYYVDFTQADQLTVAFMTLMSRAVLVRVNSAQSNDFLEMRLVGRLFINPPGPERDCPTQS